MGMLFLDYFTPLSLDELKSEKKIPNKENLQDESISHVVD